VWYYYTTDDSLCCSSFFCSYQASFFSSILLVVVVVFSDYLSLSGWLAGWRHKFVGSIVGKPFVYSAYEL
jgi:hypothetical protein